jgi:hypothetical protein
MKSDPDSARDLAGLSDWVSFLTYPNLFGIKDFVVVVLDATICSNLWQVGLVEIMRLVKLSETMKL